MTRLRPQAIVFDFDGVVIDSERANTHAWATALSEVGIGTDLWLAAWESQLGVGTRISPADLLAPSMPDLDWRAVNDARRLLKQEIIDRAGPLPGVMDWLDQAKEVGLKLGIASNGTANWVDRQLKRLHLERRFDAVVTAGGTIREKPYPDTYCHAFELMDVHGGQAIAIEDSLLGAKAAVSAGAKLIVIGEPLGADAVSSLGEFLLVRSLADVSLRQAVDLVWPPIDEGR